MSQKDPLFRTYISDKPTIFYKNFSCSFSKDIFSRITNQYPDLCPDTPPVQVPTSPKT